MTGVDVRLSGKQKTKRTRLLLGLLISLLSNVPCVGQIGGQQIFEFLNLPVSARQSALGTDNITLSDDDIAQSIINPATLNFRTNNQLSFQYQFHFVDIKSGYVGYGFKYEKWKLDLSGGLQFINYGDFTGADEMGNKTVPFSAAEYALQLGASKIIRDRWRGGVNFKIITSRLAEFHAAGIALDLGLHHLTRDSLGQFAIVIRQVGTQISKYVPDVKEKLPFNMLIGYSRKLKYVPLRLGVTIHDLHRWNLVFDDPNSDIDNNLFGEPNPEKSQFSTFVDNIFRHLILRSEFLLGRGEQLAIRFAYNHQRKKELSVKPYRSLAGFSGGLGVNLKAFKLDYGFSVYHIAGSTHHLGLRTSLSRFFPRNKAGL